MSEVAGLITKMFGKILSEILLSLLLAVLRTLASCKTSMQLVNEPSNLKHEKRLLFHEERQELASNFLEAMTGKILPQKTRLCVVRGLRSRFSLIYSFILFTFSNLRGAKFFFTRE